MGMDVSKETLCPSLYLLDCLNSEPPKIGISPGTRLCTHIGVFVKSGPLEKIEEWGFFTWLGSAIQLVPSSLVLHGKVPNPWVGFGVAASVSEPTELEAAVPCSLAWTSPALTGHQTKKDR